MVEDDILFTNHLVGKWEILAEIMECYPSKQRGHVLSWL